MYSESLYLFYFSYFGIPRTPRNTRRYDQDIAHPLLLLRPLRNPLVAHLRNCNIVGREQLENIHKHI